MITGTIVNGRIRLVESVDIAVRLFDRMKGLLGRSSLGVGRGLLIRPCNSVHTMFMRFAIDLIFVDRNLKVVKIIRNARTGRPFFWGGLNATAVLEIESGWLNPNLLRVGDTLRFLPSE